VDRTTTTGLTIYSASRPCAGEIVNGDAWTMQQRGNVYRISVIDGLGHGEIANTAAMTAVEALEHAPELGVLDALALCHRSLHSTRGAAMCIADVDLANGKLVFSGIGNVEGILWHADARSDRLVPSRGIAGANAPTLRSFEFELSGDWMMLLHSDGISSRVNLDSWPGIGTHDENQHYVESLLSEWGREHDDVTVLVVCPTPM
jgi:serine phosphatase RsbU (regulator of sigma subunit)